MIYRNLRGISKLVELEFELLNNPSIAEPLGLDPLKRPPSDERFSEFLRSNPNGYLQSIREPLLQELIYLRKWHSVGLLCHRSLCKREQPKDRYEKHRLPSGDRDARLGVTIHFSTPFKKKIHCFWGCRNHVINDLESEPPIAEMTSQANKDEKKVGLPILKNLHQDLPLPVKIVAADANFDV